MVQRKVTPKMIQEMKKLFENGLNARDVASTLDLSESTVRKYLPEESHYATERKLNELDKRRKQH